MKRFICLLLSALMLTACTPASSVEDPNGGESDKSKVDTEIIEQEIDASQSYVTGNYTRVEGQTIQKYPRLTNLPTLYITLDNGKRLRDVEHDIYSPATYTFVDQHIETSYYELPLQIKGRGNYSWTFAQKPYTIKFDDAADLLGMGAAKKWVLVSLSSDKSMLHNYLTQKLAAKMGLEGTVENEYVDVVVNGEYSGTYVLTESIQLHDSRLNIPGNEGILFEIEMVRRHSCVVCVEMEYNRRTPQDTIHIELKEYKGQEVDEIDAQTQKSIQEELEDFFANVEEAMKSGTPLKLAKYVDVDSFVDWYLLNEFTRNYDSQFVSSVYCYINEEGKLYMGPCWDYDTCYGIQDNNTEGSHILGTAPWYQWLFEYSPAFVQKVKERWTEMREKGGLIDQFNASIDETVEYISMSEKMQHWLYPNSELTDLPYDDAVDYMKDWIKDRLKWMDREYLLKNK